MKDFDRWNKIKKSVHGREVKLFCNAREIWWCSLGLNVGSEEDGKNELFERPILVLKVFNQSMLRVAPLTSKAVDDHHHVSVSYNGRGGSVILSQTKTISIKRLSRKLCRLDQVQFAKVLAKLKESIS